MKCLDEYLKRKRVGNTEEEEEESEVFKKNKLTMRSPKSEKNVEEKIEDLTRVIMEMEEKLGEKLERFFRDEFTRWKTATGERGGLEERKRRTKKRSGRVEAKIE